MPCHFLWRGTRHAGWSNVCLIPSSVIESSTLMIYTSKKTFICETSACRISALLHHGGCGFETHQLDAAGFPVFCLRNLFLIGKPHKETSTHLHKHINCVRDVSLSQWICCHFLQQCFSIVCVRVCGCVLCFGECDVSNRNNSLCLANKKFLRFLKLRLCTSAGLILSGHFGNNQPVFCDAAIRPVSKKEADVTLNSWVVTFPWGARPKGITGEKWQVLPSADHKFFDAKILRVERVFWSDGCMWRDLPKHCPWDHWINALAVLLERH